MIGTVETLAVLVRADEIIFYGAAPRDTNVIRLHANAGVNSSHVVIPVVHGTLGGAPPQITYPPRPFLADAAE